MESDPPAFPEFKLFHSRRLGEVADFIGNILHLVFDRHRNPTPSEHHFEDNHPDNPSMTQDEIDQSFENQWQIHE